MERIFSSERTILCRLETPYETDLEIRFDPVECYFGPMLAALAAICAIITWHTIRVARQSSGSFAKCWLADTNRNRYAGLLTTLARSIATAALFLFVLYLALAPIVIVGIENEYERKSNWYFGESIGAHSFAEAMSGDPSIRLEIGGYLCGLETDSIQGGASRGVNR